MAWCESGAREPFSLFRFCVPRVNKKQPFRRTFEQKTAPHDARASGANEKPPRHRCRGG
jgi:hypothetical protein